MFFDHFYIYISSNLAVFTRFCMYIYEFLVFVYTLFNSFERVIFTCIDQIDVHINTFSDKI